MKHLSFGLVLLLAAVLTACGGVSTPTPTAPPTSAPASTRPPTSAPSAGSAQAPAGKPSEAAPTTAPQTATATKVLPTPDIQKIVNAQPDDWKRGSDGAKVTIIEWGDFQ